MTQEAAACRDLIFVDSSSLPERDYTFLCFSLQTKFANDLLIRSSSQTAQPHLTLTLVRDIPLFWPGEAVREAVLKAVQLSYSYRSQAISSYAQAETLLLRELGLEGWDPPKPVAYQRQASEIFSDGRWDAEYYQPSTTQLLNTLQKFGSVNIDELADVHAGFPWASAFFLEDGQPGAPFVRIRDCKPGAIENGKLDQLVEDYAHSQMQQKARTGDIVIGMDGLKYFYASLIQEPCYVNQRIAWIQQHSDSPFPSEYLMLIINCVIGQTQLLRQMTIANTVGHITNQDVRNLLIPKMRDGVMKQMSLQIKSSFAAKAMAKRLLETAKRAVEVAIEDSEGAALALLKNTDVAIRELG